MGEEELRPDLDLDGTERPGCERLFLADCAAERIFRKDLPAEFKNLPFINEKGNVFYPISLAEIPAREFVKAKRLARPVSTAEFED